MKIYECKECRYTFSSDVDPMNCPNCGVSANEDTYDILEDDDIETGIMIGGAMENSEIDFPFSPENSSDNSIDSNDTSFESDGGEFGGGGASDEF